MLHHRGTKELETKRLVLRRASLDDSMAMARNWASNPEVTKYLSWAPYSSIEGVEAWISSQIKLWQNEKHYNWFIELKAIREVIGTIGFVRIDETIDSLDIGYVIGQPWWGQGIVPEALNEVLRFAFECLGANRVSGQHDVSNPNSGRVMLKCGMSHEGILRQAARNNRGIIDICCHSILAEDYRRDKSVGYK